MAELRILEDRHPVTAEIRKIVKKWHPHLVESEARIVAVMNEDGMSKRDKIILGKAQKATALLKKLTDYDFALLLNEPAWKKLSEEQQTALLDHELSHMAAEQDKNDEWKFFIRSHDLEEFRAVVERHGQYLQDIVDFVAAANSNPLLPFEQKESA
jgi:hypothetical protein